MTESEAIERLYNMKNKVDVALMNSKYDEVQGTADALEMAINALEKQIPKKYMRKNGNYNCPICNYPVMSVCTRKKKYCDNCGQAIDWSDEE